MQVYNPYTGQMEEIPDYADPSAVKDQYLPGLREVALQHNWQQALGNQQQPPDTAPQEQAPGDYWTRVAQATGGRGPFGRIYTRGRPTGLESFMALGSGFANARVGRAANRANEVEDRNKRAAEAASTLAKHRYETARDAEKSNLDLQRELAVKRTPSASSGTPAKDTFIDIVDPQTGRMRTIRESQWQPGMNRYYPPKDQSSATRVRLNAKNLADIAQQTNVIMQTQDIRKLYRKEFVGPAAGQFGEFKSKFAGRSLAPGQADFRSALATYANAARNALYGSALTKQEIDAAVKQIPSVNDPSEVFEAKLGYTQHNLIRAAQSVRDNLDAMNVDISRLKPLPEAVPLFGEGAAQTPGINAGAQAPPRGQAPAVQSPDDKVLIERNGKKGYISRKFVKPTDKVLQ
jgi:hypothetical protein